MCPLYPLHLVVMYGGVIATLLLATLGSVEAAVVKQLEVNLDLGNSSSISVTEGETEQIFFQLEDFKPDLYGQELLVQLEPSDGIEHAKITHNSVIQLPSGGDSSGDAAGEMQLVPESNSLQGSFNITGEFLGYSSLAFVAREPHGGEETAKSSDVPVKVQRGDRVMDKIFIHVVIMLVIVAYINMGCAIDVEVIKQTLRRPIAPVIGIFSQYLFMPLVGYGLGYAIFPDNPALWLGMFITGCAPGGGGSNMWTYLLGGSLDLSVTMTFISTMTAFAALPFWLYMMGSGIYADGEFTRMPYRNIAMLVVGLVLPCGIGLLIRRFAPRCAAVLKKMLGPVSLIFIVFMMTFGVYANLYIFAFFSWKVAIGGTLIPLLGFIFGLCVSLICRRPMEEVIAISVETGVQNTGLAIGVLKIALGEFQPLADITIIIPIAAATMTPLPLTVAYLGKKLYAFCKKSDEKELPPSSSADISPSDSFTPLHKGELAVNGFEKMEKDRFILNNGHSV